VFQEEMIRRAHFFLVCSI